MYSPKVHILTPNELAISGLDETSFMRKSTAKISNPTVNSDRVLRYMFAYVNVRKIRMAIFIVEITVFAMKLNSISPIPSMKEAGGGIVPEYWDENGETFMIVIEE